MADVHTPVGDAPVIPLVIIGTGMYLAWFGVHYWRSDTKWPTDPVKAVLQGKPVPAGGNGSAQETADLTAAFSSTSTGSGGTSTGGDTAGGPAWSHAQLMTLWTSNGGAQASARIAGAIALAESSGNPKVTSGNPDGGTNVGLWQLDTPGGKGAGYTVAQLQDPDTNARVTIMGSANGTDWSAWATYVTGAYLRYMT